MDQLSSHRLVSSFSEPEASLCAKDKPSNQLNQMKAIAFPFFSHANSRIRVRLMERKCLYYSRSELTAKRLKGNFLHRKVIESYML
jgi:hypothetical protein